ncbi:BLUF domain-containing protein [Stenotrophomonas sp. 278]|uniref:BLUF domain-containing protein n=1 Tax=Stenotrophomonas sp. 278 TaxID=2479851 RepID=UPI000F65E19E|nr:BLUF domain-containing protein [Stenotrophomonas sp. 278]RRU09108.1 BLUF domain-containing protein [Stenotrophomonas sp. 278]
MPIRAVAYVSTACSEIAEHDALGIGSGKLDALVDDAARFNRQAGVTGVLLFDGTRFFQYMEGPEDGLGIAYGRVLAASSHHDVIELQQGLVGRRLLPFWPMRWLHADCSQVRALATADWAAFKVRRESSTSRLTGMDIVSAVVEPHLLAG